MKEVLLDDKEWQQVMAVIAQAPWNVANPLLMKIGDQLRKQEFAGSQGITHPGQGELRGAEDGNAESNSGTRPRRSTDH